MSETRGNLLWFKVNPMGPVLMTVFEAFAGSRQSDRTVLVLPAVATGTVSLVAVQTEG